MAVTTTNNKPLNPRGNDQSPLAFNRAKLYSGKALDFDGVNDYVDLDGFTMTGNVATIVFQAKFSNDQYLLDIDIQRFVIRNRAADGFGVFNSTAWISYGDTLRDEVGFYAVVSNGTTQRVYFNGHQLGDDETITALDWDSVTKVKIASNNTGTNNFLDGQIAGFKIFNTALTAAQVADLYNNPEKIVPTGVADSALKLYLPMMEGAGTTAYDGSGNGNHGTISGATWTHGVGSPVSQTAVIDWNKGSNILYYSESFDKVAWIKSGGAVVTPNTTIAPNGLQTADTLTLSGSGYVGRNRTTNATATFSVFAKYSDTPWLFIEGYDGVDKGAWFNIQTGTLGSTNGGATATIEEAANGFYRCSITAAIAGSTTFAIFQTIADGSFTRATGDVIIWGAQVEESATLGAYIPNPTGSELTSAVLLPQGLTSGRDITGVNLFENVRKQGALNLDGNSWAEVHDNASLDMTTTATMEAWVNADGLDGGYDIIMVKSSATYWTGNYGRYTLRANNANVNWWFDDFTTNTKYYSVALSGWNHLAVTKDGTEEKLYVNGTLVSTQTGAATFTASPYSLLIGVNSSKTENWTKPIAQPRIYNRALSAEEVARNYTAGKYIYTND